MEEDDDIDDKLPSIVYEPYMKLHDKSCTICMEDYESGDSIKVLPSCNHPFHDACIEEWLKEKTSCPTC